MRYWIVLAALCFLPVSAMSADSTDVSVGKDTMLFIPPHVDRDSMTVISKINPETHLYQNPTTALFKSLFVPGLGQVGNHKYVKAVLFAGLEGWFISRAIHYGGQASDFRRQYEASTDRDQRNNYYALYKNRRDQRNKYTWFTGVVAFVSMFDAYVDAHLSGSPSAGRNRKVDLSIRPMDGGGAGAVLALNF
jgi:hypothetical protein